MIWMFLAGMIAGAVGWHMLCGWLGRKIIREQQMEAFRRNKEEDDK